MRGAYIMPIQEKRVKMPFDEEYDRYKALLDDLVGKMQNVVESGVIPPKIKRSKSAVVARLKICVCLKRKSTALNSLLRRIAYEKTFEYFVCH